MICMVRSGKTFCVHGCLSKWLNTSLHFEFCMVALENPRHFSVSLYLQHSVSIYTAALKIDVFFVTQICTCYGQANLTSVYSRALGHCNDTQTQKRTLCTCTDTCGCCWRNISQDMTLPPARSFVGNKIKKFDHGESCKSIKVTWNVGAGVFFYRS